MLFRSPRRPSFSPDPPALVFCWCCRFAQLQEVDLEESEIQDFEVLDGAGRAELRDDVPREFEEREALLTQIPLMDGDFIRLPKTTTQE